MKNGDMPAMPQSNQEIVRAYLDHEFDAPNGLTKREYFAGLAMQALVSEIVSAELNGYEITAEQTAREAIAQADALLAQLQTTEGEK